MSAPPLIQVNTQSFKKGNTHVNVPAWCDHPRFWSLFGFVFLLLKPASWSGGSPTALLYQPCAASNCCLRPKPTSPDFNAVGVAYPVFALSDAPHTLLGLQAPAPSNRPQVHLLEGDSRWQSKRGDFWPGDHHSERFSESLRNASSVMFVESRAC